MTSTQRHVDWLDAFTSIRPTYVFMGTCTYILTYLLMYTVHKCAYKTVNISETVEDRAKLTINSLYK